MSEQWSRVPRNLVLCCDGTDNQFGPNNTNVVRLVQVLDRHPARQVVYYDPGMGTLAEPGIRGRVRQMLSELQAKAFGTDLKWKVQEAYTYLMETWEPGDRVFLFGFSRGAYTVRVLAGMLHLLGLLPKGGHNLVPYAYRLFRAVPGREHGRAADEGSQYWRLCNQFRWTFARPIEDDGEDRRFPVHFVGLWDTVSSVGWVWDPASFPYTAKNPSVRIVRHAVSIDERRCFFRQNLVHEAAMQDFKQLWFAGVHSDVGGGYPENDGGLWRMPFEWILDEAAAAGLGVDQGRRDRVLHRTTPTATPWLDRQHESLTGAWWLGEFFPKLVWDETTKRRWMEFGRGRHRVIDAGQRLHREALLRMRDPTYVPPNLSEEFRAAVRALASTPDELTYQPDGTMEAEQRV